MTVMFMHEWMLCVDDEVEIYMRKGINAPIIIYFLARLTTLLYVATCAILSIYFGQPQAYVGTLYPEEWLIYVNFIAWWICSAITSLLFFFRVLAVFKHSRTKKVLFSVSWGLTSCVSLPLLCMVTGPALPASLCEVYGGESLSDVMTPSCPERPSVAMILLILVAAHNILVFISISHELLGNNSLAGVCNMRTMITGDGLLPMSKSLLRSGQLYVSVSFGLVFVTIVIYWEGNGWWALWSGISPAVECIISCRVFRALLLSERRAGESNAVIRTEDVEEMVMAAMARADEAGDPERG
ncbi:hypothetical protein HWV62_8923 [Athelia sp. TMB]|nr:hypothetical protein HWV62_8923 [Athelia sp. TMB]